MRKVALVGPEIEENLALRYIAASLEAAGHTVRLIDFHDRMQIESVAATIATWAPDVVGLSMVFTVRSREFTEVARAARAAGYRGHLVAGGHFAALHAEQLLADQPALDTVVLGEGEAPMTELVGDLDHPERVDGLCYRDRSGRPVRTASRPNSDDLDHRPWPTRPERFHRYLDRPIANLLSSRGCYADCHFCSISAFHRQSGGSRFRQRKVTEIAAEMVHLYRRRGVRIFNFQDDNFLTTSAEANLERFGALAEELGRAGVGKIGIQAKGRPDCIDEPVLDLLVSMGLFRLFLGVETDAVVGLETLGRGIERAQNHRALALLRDRAIHTCFNLLVFDPDSTMAAVRQNLDFMRRQAYFPLNFCRVEVYAGTPLEARLRSQGRLTGDFYGHGYTISSPPVQLAYELFREVFWPRNFGAGGMHHESMKLDYNYHLLRHFHRARVDRGLERQVKGIVHELNQHSAALMTEICDFAEAADPDDRAVRDRLVEALCRRRQEFDDELRRRLSTTLRRIESLATTPPRRRLFQSAAAAAALLAAGCATGSGNTHMCEMAPPPPPERTERGLSDQELIQIAGVVTQRLDTDLKPLLADKGLDHVPIQLSLTVDPQGQLVDCAGQATVAQDTVDQLCQALIGMRFEFLPKGFSEMRRGEITVVYPAYDDTHMCEMAPPPMDPAEE